MQFDRGPTKGGELVTVLPWVWNIHNTPSVLKYKGKLIKFD
jgi:hypothetical protein